MVTPGNVLVPPIWHFILLYHPVPSAFPSPHTGITLIMIIAVMIMISTAKLHPLSLSLSYSTPRGLWLTEKLPENVSLVPFFQLRPICLCFFCFYLFIIWLFHTLVALCTHCSAPLQPTSCLFSVFFNFMPVFHLCCCAPFNLPYLCHLSPAPSFSQSWFSASLLLLQSFSPLFSSQACLFYYYKGKR